MTEMTRLQSLYWEIQSIHDKLFALEHRMRKNARQGITCTNVQSKYLDLLNDLRDKNAEMILIEQTCLPD